MPLTYVGDLLTINFDKTINKNLQLQKFAVPLHCQQKKDGTEEASCWQLFDNIDHRAEIWEIVGSQVIHGKNLTICQSVMMS